MRLESSFWLHHIGDKLEKLLWWHDFQTGSRQQIFHCLISLIKFSCYLIIFYLWGIWPEIQKLNIRSSEFWPISRWMSLIKSYLLLQNARFTALTVSELLRENQQGGGVVKIPPISVNIDDFLLPCLDWQIVVMRMNNEHISLSLRRHRQELQKLRNSGLITVALVSFFWNSL